MTDDFLATRARLLREGNELRARAAELTDTDDVEAAFDLHDRADELADRYRELLPEVPVARCPHTDTVVRWPIDTAGLDGWFWNFEAPVRRRPRQLPPTWRAMTGAVRLAEPVEVTPFVVRPGPGVPFVVPRLLGADGMRAVISEVPIGAHTGWAISYFGPRPAGIGLVNLWGADTFPVYDDTGAWLGWDTELRPTAADYDFDLEPWLDSGRLLWIAPGDADAVLREGSDGCPYVGLTGTRDLPYLQQGRIWYASTA